MRKRYWIPILFLTAGGLFLRFNLAPGQDVLAEIDALLPLGNQEAAACTEWKGKVESFPWSDIGPKDPPVHASKAEAMSALGFLETYPGSPPSHHKAARLFRENRAQFISRVDQISLMGRWARLEPECDVFFPLRHAQALLEDIRLHKLGEKEAKRVREAVKAYLRQLQPAESLIAVMIHIVILQKLQEEGGNSRLAAAAKALLDDGEARRQQMQQEWERRSRWWIFTVAGVDTELKLIGDLGQRYMGLLKEAKI